MTSSVLYSQQKDTSMKKDNKITNLKQILTQQWAEADDAPAIKLKMGDSLQTMWTPTDEFREARGSIWRKCNPNTPARVLYSLYEPGLQQQKSKIYNVDFFVTLQNGILVITCASGVLAYCRFTHWKAALKLYMIET